VGSTAKEEEREEVNYEASSGDEVSDEEGEVPAANLPEAMTPEIVLSKEEVARRKKNAKAKVQRDKVRDQALAAKSQGVEGEVDAEALFAALRNAPTSEAQEAANRAEEVRCREQFAKDAREGAKRKRAPADEENGEVITEEKERSSGEA
jgi:hypothetical protein